MTTCSECARFGFPTPGIFVFGSNEGGVHGAGAARHARLVHGAMWGQCYGHQGDSFAIPTKDADYRPLPLVTIVLYVATFLQYAREHSAWTFNVSRIGCGLAGYTDATIAPMFTGAPANCRFAPEWQHILRIAALAR